jgi:sulfur carrier protein
MMEVLTINGVQKQFPEDELPRTVAKLLEHFDINEATVVAEIDGRIIQKQNFADTSLSDGQSIELVRFVGGG